MPDDFTGQGEPLGGKGLIFVFSLTTEPFIFVNKYFQSFLIVLNLFLNLIFAVFNCYTVETSVICVQHLYIYMIFVYKLRV